MKKVFLAVVVAFILETPVFAEEAKPRNPFLTGQVVFVTPSLSEKTESPNKPERARCVN